MSLFGSLMGDVEDDPFFGSHMRHMRQMNNMMNSLFSDPFGMLGGDGPLAIMGPRGGNVMMPFMPHMPMNQCTRVFAGNMDPGHMSSGSSFCSSTVVMSSGPGGKPQVYSSSSSTKIGPHGIKETRKTLQDSRTGTKKMSIGHHIGERAHVIEREQNYYTGDAEETQEFINLEEDEAEDFDREFQQRAGAGAARGSRRAIAPAPAPAPALALAPAPASPPRRALPAAPALAPHKLCSASRRAPSPGPERAPAAPRPAAPRAAPRRPLRTSASPLTTSSSPSVREVYGGSHPQRRRHPHSHPPHRRHAPAATPPPRDYPSDE